LQIGGDEAHLGEGAAGGAQDGGDVDAGGAAQATSPAHRAAPVHRLDPGARHGAVEVARAHEPGGEPPHGREAPPEDGGDLRQLVGRHRLRLAVGEVVVAGLGAQPATHAGLEVGGVDVAQPRAEGRQAALEVGRRQPLDARFQIAEVEHGAALPVPAQAAGGSTPRRPKK
jgi:hypothetical protein